MEIEKVLNNGRAMRAITSLDHGEFEQLLFAFEKEWQKQNARKTFEGTARQRRAGGGFPGCLSTARHKLFFILMYFKLYPIQEAMAFFWGLSQGQVCTWIHRLTPVLEAALGRKLKLPERQPAKLHEVLQQSPDLRLIMDGTERRTRRPQDKDQQKTHYSGKKKTHSKKNVLITSGRRVVYLSATHPGSCSDRTIARAIENRRFPQTSILFQDRGFQGFVPKGADLLMPLKKPKGQELSPQTKAINQLISSYRVRIEHVISGIKRCRIVTDIFRNVKSGFDDLVMEIACGLHNLRTDTRCALA